MSTVFINPYSSASAGGPPPTLVTSVAAGGTSNTVTTANINTTGANLIVISASWFPGGTNAGTVSDSNGNTWTPLTRRGNTGLRQQLFYCYAPIVSSSHNFTYAGAGLFQSMCVAAFNNVATSPFDVENGNVISSSSTVSTGSISPSQATTLVVTGLSLENNSGGAISINGGYSIAATATYSGGNHEGCSIAYLVLSSATSQNPTWNVTNSASTLTAAIASFKY